MPHPNAPARTTRNRLGAFLALSLTVLGLLALTLLLNHLLVYHAHNLQE